MRLGEKRILHHYIDLYNRCARLLSLSLVDLMREIGERENDSDPIDIYIRSVVVPLVQKFGEK
jgi:hypothetical protein